MIGYIKDISTGLFLLIVAFSYSIFFIVQDAFGFPIGGSTFQIYSGVLAIIAVVMYVANIQNIPSKINGNVLKVVITVVFLFFITRFFYGGAIDLYNSYFLSMGVRFVPALLVGVMMINDNRVLIKIEKALLPFAIFYTLILVLRVSTATVGVNMVETFNTEGGMSYQDLSYYAVFALGMILYVLVYGGYNIIVQIFLLFIAFVLFYITIATGSRGAFILAAVFILYFGIKKISFKKIIIYIIVGYIIVSIIWQSLGGDELFLLGFYRIFNFFSDNSAVEEDIRWERWYLALKAFEESPILGNGIGSVFYKVGFYSHNMFTDMLCEGGLILITFFLYLIKKTYSCARYLIKNDSKNEIMVLIFFCDFIMSCFSGYYLTVSGMWMTMAFFLGSRHKYIHIV